MVATPGSQSGNANTLDSRESGNAGLSGTAPSSQAPRRIKLPAVPAHEPGHDPWGDSAYDSDNLLATIAERSR